MMTANKEPQKQRAFEALCLADDELKPADRRCTLLTQAQLLLEEDPCWLHKMALVDTPEGGLRIFVVFNLLKQKASFVHKNLGGLPEIQIPRDRWSVPRKNSFGKAVKLHEVIRPFREEWKDRGRNYTEIPAEGDPSPPPCPGLDEVDIQLLSRWSEGGGSMAELCTQSPEDQEDVISTLLDQLPNSNLLELHAFNDRVFSRVWPALESSENLRPHADSIGSGLSHLLAPEHADEINELLEPSRIRGAG